MRTAYKHVDRMLRVYLSGYGSFGEFRTWALAIDPKLYDAAVYARINVPTMAPLATQQMELPF